MIELKPNAALHTAMRTTLVTLALVLGSSALAQWDMAEYNAYMDALVAQRYAQIGEQQNEAMTYFVRYYREQTGDYQTPDALAVEYGMNLYCQRNAAECRDVHQTYSERSREEHESNMRAINSWEAVNAGIAASNASILDSSHQGFLDRSRMQDQGQANMIQGAVQGQWNYVNPSSGAQWNLPVMPDPNTQYWTPEGQPLSFDFQAGVWYVGTQWGWTPLQPQR